MSDDDLATRRAMAQLDGLAEAWAEKIGLARAIDVIAAHDDRETRFMAFAKLAYVEGCYFTFADAKEGRIPSLMLRAEHDRRVTELLEANNREVERRREAEAEVQFWRQELAAKLKMALALAKVAEDRGLEGRAAEWRGEVNVILNAFRDADAKEWHDRCVECGEFILPGTPTIQVGDDDGSDPAHASCFGQTEGTPETRIDVAATIAAAKTFMGRDDA